MKKKFLAALVTLLLCATTLTGCQVDSPKICYTVYPIRYLVEKLAGDKVQLCSISNNEIVLRSHIVDNYQEVLGDADLLLYVGQVEPYMHIYLPQIRENKNLDIVDLANTTSIYNFSRYTEVTIGESSLFVESPYYDSSVFNSIDTYDKDPYIWMDPIAMTSVASQIKDWLVANYTEESDYFEQQYDLLETELARLDSEFQVLRMSENHIKIVTMTPSFGAWQKNYNIDVYPVILSRYGVLPNDEQLQLIEQRIINDDVKYIVYESNMTDDMIALFNKIKDDLGLVQINLSNLSSLTDQQITDKKDYVQLMYENLSVLENLVE